MGNAQMIRETRDRMPVHPHVHGERETDWHEIRKYFGSSPRTWGTLQFNLKKDRVKRFIPTYMGNACPVAHGQRHRVVHPHVHGERILRSR